MQSWTPQAKPPLREGSLDREFGIGILGAGFIGQMHALAFRNASVTARKPRLRARLRVVCDRNDELRREVADRYEFTRHTADWRELMADPSVDVFVNAGPNELHREPSIAAAEAGKSIFCEKPLASTADEAYATWKGVDATGVLHMCAFMYRSFPALNLAREMIRSGELGEIRHFRSRFLMNMLTPDGNLSWRFSRARAGHGAVGDLGSHHIDQARFLVGEVKRVGTVMKTWSRDRSGRITDVNDDAFVCAAELENGATASFEASRTAQPHNLGGFIEIDGTLRSIGFHMERLNELTIYEPGRGPRAQMVTGADHPYADFWLPVGVQGQHPIGWTECFAIQARHMLMASAGKEDVGPRATLKDGYRVAEIVDAIERSAGRNAFEEIVFKE